MFFSCFSIFYIYSDPSEVMRYIKREQAHHRSVQGLVLHQAEDPVDLLYKSMHMQLRLSSKKVTVVPSVYAIFYQQKKIFNVNKKSFKKRASRKFFV